MIWKPGRGFQRPTECWGCPARKSYVTGFLFYPPVNSERLWLNILYNNRSLVLLILLNLFGLASPVTNLIGYVPSFFTSRTFLVMRKADNVTLSPDRFVIPRHSARLSRSFDLSWLPFTLCSTFTVTGPPTHLRSSVPRYAPPLLTVAPVSSHNYTHTVSTLLAPPFSPCVHLAPPDGSSQPTSPVKPSNRQERMTTSSG
jgi:hypothetical protein